MFTAALPGNVLLFGANRIENSFPSVADFHRAVAQQRVDQIRYIASSFPGAVLSASSYKLFFFRNDHFPTATSAPS
jgi:hypothetical protein